MADATHDADVLDLEGFATHRVGLDEAPEIYSVFQKKQDACQEVVLTP